MPFAIRKVPVGGGDLRVGFRPGKTGAPVVVLVHGITANHLSWSMVAEQLGEDATLVAPDLRGRAGSASLPGPFGMANHALDLLAVLDYIGVGRATVVGHSMGVYAAAAFAVNHADRLAGLVLVDGGVSFATLPEGADIDAVLTALLGPTMKRLSMTFADVDAWLALLEGAPLSAELERRDREVCSRRSCRRGAAAAVKLQRRGDSRRRHRHAAGRRSDTFVV